MKLIILIILSLMMQASACAQPYLSIPSDLRELPYYALPGSRYGLLHGSPGIPHFAKPVAGQSQLLNALLSQRHSIEILSITSTTWSRASSMHLADESSWSFVDAARINCPAPHCLLLGGPVQWLVTTDADFNMIDSALVSAMESSYSEDLKRQSERAVLDSNFGWGGEQATYPLDRVQRQFHADRPNQLWVSDFTYVSTWQGWLYVAFVVDVFARRIVGWRVSNSMKTDFVLDALEQALHARRPCHMDGLVHHSDRGSQYVSIRYTERLAEAEIEPSVGSKGDSYDNALAETINGLYKAELIYRQSWRSREAVEIATLKWVHWFNHQRLLGSIGYIPPAEAEANFYQQHIGQAIAA